MTLEQTFWGDPEVTDERRATWQKYVEDYAITTAQMWIEQGTDRQEAAQGAAVIIADYATIDDLPWMPLGKALNVRTGAVMSGKELQGQERVDFMLAMRTAQTSTEDDRIACIAYQLGVSVQHARTLAGAATRANPSLDRPSSAGGTALYRHFDKAGVLLYVGITQNPSARTSQHASLSGWYRFADRTAVEWFPTRKDAEDAERAAICDERPVFNSTHNKRNRQAAIDYLFAALEEVPS